MAGETLAQLQVVVSAPLATLGRDLAQMRSMVAANTSPIGRMFQTAFGFVGGSAIISAVQGVVGGIKGMVAEGFNFNAQMETMQTGFEVMLGSAAKARKMIGDLKDFAKITPFETDNLAQAAQMLMSTKAVAEKDLIPTLRKIGDAAAGSSKGFASLPHVMLAVTQMMMKGKISAEEMSKQLVNAGIPAWSILSDKMGISVKTLMQMAKEGKLGLDAVMLLVDGMGDRFSGMMQKQSRTWMGLMSTIRDSIKINLGDAFKPLFEKAKSYLTIISDAMAGIQSPATPKIAWLDKLISLIPSAKTIAEWIEKIINMVETGLQNPLVQAAGKFAAITVAVLGVFAAVATVKAAVLTVVGLLGGWTIPILAAAAAIAGIVVLIQRAFAGPDGAKFLALWNEIKFLVIEIGMNLRDMILPVIVQVRDAMAIAFSADGGLQKGFDSFLGTVMNGLVKILDFLSILTSDWDLMWEYISAKAAETAVLLYEQFRHVLNVQIPFAIVAMWDGMIAGGIEAFSQLGNYFEALINFWKELFNTFIDMWIARFKYITEAIKLAKAGDPAGALEAIVAGESGAVAAGAQRSAEATKTFAGTMAGIMSSVLEKTMAAMKPGLDAMPDRKDSPLLAELKKRSGEAWEALKKEREKDRRERAGSPKKGLPEELPVAPFGAGGEEDGGEKKAEEEEKAKQKIDFVGLADLNKRIQQALGSAEAKNQKAMIAGINKVAVAAEKNVVVGGEIRDAVKLQVKMPARFGG